MVAQAPNPFPTSPPASADYEGEEPPRPETRNQRRATEFAVRWARRAITIPLYSLLAVLSLASLPLLVPLAALVDLARGRRFATMRCVLFFTFYLCCEAAGIIACFGAWLFSGVWMGGDRKRFERWNFVLEGWWARALLRGAILIFAMSVEVAGDDQIGPGPILLFIRHASVGDTLLPAVFVSSRHGFALRYVLKRELLWDPCLDIAGSRLPNCFVRRGSGESAKEIASVQRLMEGLGRQEGVLIYPEGTRFTPAKRARALIRLAASAPDLHAKAAALVHVLPPRPGGPLALLGRNAGADAVFCAHVGFEQAGGFGELLDGALVGRTIRVEFWRVPFEEIPKTRSDQAVWLYEWWGRVDDWVGRNLETRPDSDSGSETSHRRAESGP